LDSESIIFAQIEKMDFEFWAIPFLGGRDEKNSF
jgi:hypothetical protein